MIELSQVYKVVNALIYSPDSERSSSYLYNDIVTIKDIIGMDLTITCASIDAQGNCILPEEKNITTKASKHLYFLQRENLWRVGYSSGNESFFEKDVCYKFAPLPDHCLTTFRCFGDEEQIKKDFALLLLFI